MLLTVVLTFLIIIIFVIIIWHIICWLGNWSGSLDRDNLYIKYSDFKKSYDTNPNKWNLQFDNVRFQKEGSGYYNKTTFQFYPIGYYRYKLWRNLAERKQRQANKKKAYQEVMSQIKSSTQYGQLSDVQSPSIEIEVDKKHRDTFIKSIQKYLKEELGMEVKVVNEEAKDETSI